MHTEPMLLTVEQAAGYCGWSPSKMWTLVMNGDVPSLKVIGSRRIARQALEEWISAQEEAARQVMVEA